MRRTALILAGGSGTRLWPLSTEDNPKQFLEIFEGSSLLQKTVQRFRTFLGIDSIFVSTHERYREKVLTQLPDLPSGNVLPEPHRRNTAPAIAVCCTAIERKFGECVIGVFPSDAAVVDETAFRNVVELAYRHAEASRDLVTIAIAPTEPHTGYGYLELGEEIAPDVIRLRRFVEKPDRDRAEEFLRAGNFAWNGGMFVWRSDVFRESLVRTAPDIQQMADDYVSSPTADRYAAARSISIDYALMEKSSNVATVRGDFGWSDVGSWAAVARLTSSRTTGPLVLENATDVFALSHSARPIVSVGVSNVAVIESADGLLILSLAEAEKLSAVVKRLG